MIFDWGGVLVDDPADGLVQYCAAKLGVDAKGCRCVFETHLPPFQRGEVLEEAFWQKVCQDLTRPVPGQASLWGEAFGAVCRPRDAMYGLAEALREYYKIAVLSNTEAAAVEHFLTHRSELFEVKVFSCEEGAVKPDGRLFEICLERLRVEPDEAVLVDDRIENVSGARAVGLQGIVYESYRSLAEQLEGLGVEPLLLRSLSDGQ